MARKKNSKSANNSFNIGNPNDKDKEHNTSLPILKSKEEKLDIDGITEGLLISASENEEQNILENNSNNLITDKQNKSKKKGKKSPKEKNKSLVKRDQPSLVDEEEAHVSSVNETHNIEHKISEPLDANEHIDKESLIYNKEVKDSSGSVNKKKITNFDYLDEVEEIEAKSNQVIEVEEEDSDEAPEALSLTAEKQKILDQDKLQKKLLREEKKKRAEKNRLKDSMFKAQSLKRKEAQAEEDDIVPLPLDILKTAAENSHKKSFEIEEEEEEELDDKALGKQIKKAKKAHKLKSEKIVGDIKVKRISKDNPWDLPAIKVDRVITDFLNDALYNNQHPAKKRTGVGLIPATPTIAPAPKFVRD